MSQLDVTAPAAHGGPSAWSTGDPVARAFRQVQVANLRAAAIVRTLSLATIAVLLIALIPWPGVFYLWGMLTIFILLGIGQYLVKRWGKGEPFFDYLFVAADMSLLGIVLFVPNPLVETVWPPEMVLRNGVFVYFFVLLVAVAACYSPRLLSWAGICGALVWTVGTFDLAIGAGAVTSWDIPADADGLDVLSFHLDPRFIDLDVWLQDVVVFLLVAGALSVISHRSRRVVYRQVESARERANLARYFAPTIVEQLSRLDQPFATVSEQPVAVLFADIVGWTGLAERERPATVVALLRQFHARMETAVFDNGGTLDKFLGDGLMATFGTPDRGPRDAINAMRAAAAMLASIDELNEVRANAGEAPIRLSIGIHYGDVILGDIGSERRLEFAVLGDTVNVASRLENMTRQLACRVAISEALVTAAIAEDRDAAQALLAPYSAQATETLRGRADPITIWVKY